ncbi:hypothetical protein ACFSKL_11595 [Belliella marina]|uniref:Uncharacterized protein n=1 Tax=Belliella marina TaxID=1644146 RepID=A0ABW4VPG5_9BACT
MKQFFVQLLIVLTVFITAEVIVQDRELVYHDELPEIANSEWVCTDDLPLVFNQSYQDGLPDTDGATPLKPKLASISYSPLQAFFYREKLQQKDGFTFVFLQSRKSNIPHLNRDEEYPTFFLG